MRDLVHSDKLGKPFVRFNLTLKNTHFHFFLSRDFPQKMASALSENPASVIHSLNLAHNTLDNQGTMLYSVNSFFPSYCWLSQGTSDCSFAFTSPQFLFGSQRIQNQSLSSQNPYFLLLFVFTIFFLSSIFHAVSMSVLSL